MNVPSKGHPLAVVGLILNILFPGIGTLVIRKIGAGIIQLILWLVAALFALTGVGLIVAVPVYAGVWIWALILSIRAFSQV